MRNCTAGMSMNVRSYEENFHFESFHWWYIGRRHLVKTLICRYLRSTNEVAALDIGCGTGIFLNDLARYGKAYGLDASLLALCFTRRRKVDRLTCGDVCHLPYPEKTFDLVTLLGVLYNSGVQDDMQAVAEAYRVLKSGGLLLIDEAAYRILQSEHNRRVGGIRRYTSSELVVMCRHCGFRVLRASYWNMFLLPVSFIAVILEKGMRRRKNLAQPFRIHRALNRLLIFYNMLESAIIQVLSLPCGPSVIIAARKP